MDENYNQNDKSTPKSAIVSLYLGIASIFVLLLSIVLGFLVESIGIVSFFNVVFVLALAAIVCGIIARQKITTEKFPGIRTANTGLILGLIAMFLSVFLRFAVFLFFIPWLGR